MKSLILFAAFLAVMHALALPPKSKKVHQVPMVRVPSLRARLIKEGKWAAVYKQIQDNINKPVVRASGGQPLIDYYDDFYLSNITMGTPWQTFTIVPDTGSSNLWLIDAQLCTSQACMGYPGYSNKNRFDKTKSSTFQNDGTPFSITYGSGSCRGTLAIDTFSFSGTGLTYPTQRFGLSSTIADVFGYQPIDGICGLGWPQLAVDGVTPPVQNLQPQLDQFLFTVWMDRKTQISMGATAGLITYGAVDMVNCQGTPNYVGLSSDTYWQFPIQGFSVGSYNNMQGVDVISDTGTSWLGAPTAAMNGIVSATGAQYNFNYGLYQVPCTAQNTAPNLVFTIGGNQYTIPAIEYILDLELGGGQCALAAFDMSGIGIGPQWILGDVFIRTYCNVFDVGNNRIGFMMANH